MKPTFQRYLACGLVALGLYVGTGVSSIADAQEAPGPSVPAAPAPSSTTPAPSVPAPPGSATSAPGPTAATIPTVPVGPNTTVPGSPGTTVVVPPPTEPTVLESTTTTMLEPTTTTTLGPRVVPPEFLPKINSVRRSAARDTTELDTALAPLIDAGVDKDEVVKIGYGQFPVGGQANYWHDWWMPRFTPSFHLHQGTDVFAPMGTPLRAPVDGIFTQRQGGAGGIGARVTQPDGTFFYFAHMQSWKEGLADGTPVKQGDIIGYVGDSGNADGGTPHLHFQWHPGGGAAKDPKPLLDEWLAAAMDEAPGIVAGKLSDVTGEPISSNNVVSMFARTRSLSSVDRPVQKLSGLSFDPSLGRHVLDGKVRLAAAETPKVEPADPDTSVGAQKVSAAFDGILDGALDMPLLAAIRWNW